MRLAEFNHTELTQLYGTKEGYTCKHCAHLIHLQYDNPILKCTKARVTSSAASDWRAGWQACGLFTDQDRIQENPE